MFKLIYGEHAYMWAAVRIKEEKLTAEQVMLLVASRSVNEEHVRAWLDSKPKPGDMCVWFVSGIFVCCGE